MLIGRWWGAQAVGLYGCAYQLINIPTENLNFAAGEVAFPALSRVQDDPPRLRRYFLKGYSLVVGLTVPITIACALLANDLISVVLGPKLQEAILIFGCSPHNSDTRVDQSADLARAVARDGRA